MRVPDLLARLSAEGIRLRLEAGRLTADAPRGTLSEEHLARIRESKTEIIEFLSRASGGGATPIPPILPVPRDRELSLSYAQQRAWFLEQIQPGCPMHNLPGGWMLTGALDLGALRRSFDELLRRHEVLRQRFGQRDGMPVLTVVDSCDFPLPLRDLRDVAADEREAELMRLIADEIKKPIDLEAGPLIHAVLYRLADDRHALLFMPHHIVWDAWSFDLMLREVSALYAAFAAGLPSPLPDLPVQYADYAAWEQQLVSGDAIKRDEEYWKRQLSGPLPVLDLATDFPRPDAITYRGTSEVMDLPASIAEGIRSLAASESATPYMVALAAVSVLLSRYSGQDDILVGCPIENTLCPELEPMIGYFVNMLVMRTRIDHEASFRGLLRQTRATCLDAFDHQSLPFERLVEQLNLPRDTSRTPVFQSIFLHQDARTRPDAFGDLQLTQFNVPMGSSQADVHFWLKTTNQGWLLGLDYSTDLFKATTVRRMLRHWCSILDVATRAPDTIVGELELLSPAERHDLIEARNATVRDFGSSGLIHELIEAQVARTPERLAVTGSGGSISYSELDERANRLAQHLGSLGIGPGALVGVAVERTAELPVVLLGVLKAGAAYLPIDPEFPRDRIAYMLRDSHAALLLTEEGLLEELASTDIEVVCVDRDAADILAHPARRPETKVSPSDLAYVIYTSGSTGQPKGVELQHDNLANLLCAMAERPGLHEDDTLVAVTTLCFDISAFEIFCPLTVGAHVVVASSEQANEGDVLLDLLVASKASVLQATPATWRMLFDAGWPGDPELRAICGGEALPLDLAQRLSACCRELWNVYGPTETTVWSTCARVEPGLSHVGIGTPLANTEVYVLDARRRPTPPGVPGELYIGGAGVARGYRGRPELTAERFVENPFSKRPQARMYRTGDRARFRSDGSLDYLGRLDNQVKVRGFRIELGEIESVLTAHEAVRQAVVGVSQAGGEDARLVAYVIFEPGQDLTVSETRRFLRERLPEYMVPGLVVTVDSFPLTPNGKVDRKSLPDPLAAGAQRTTGYTEPRTDEERLISAVWSELLDIERVSRTDNFYEIGGHSLLSLRAVVEIERRSGQRLDPRAMFFQTVEQLGQGLRGGAE